MGVDVRGWGGVRGVQPIDAVQCLYIICYINFFNNLQHQLRRYRKIEKLKKREAQHFVWSHGKHLCKDTPSFLFNPFNAPRDMGNSADFMGTGDIRH